MDEINEKAINDIIKYYDSLEKVHEPEEEEKEEDVPALVDIIEEARAEKNEPEEIKPEVAEEVEEKSDEEVTEETEVTEEAEEESDEAVAEEADATEEKEEQEPEEQEEKTQLSVIEDLTETDKSEDPSRLSKKNKLIITAVTALAAVLVVVLVTVDGGIIGAYKKNAAKNLASVFNRFGIDISHSEMITGKSSAKKTQGVKNTVKDTVTVPMETAGKSVFSEFNGGIVSAYTNYLSLIGSDGAIVWENTTTIVNPILETAGNYILIAEKGGKKICLYNDSRLVYEADTEDNILTCSLSANGDVAAVTDKAAYKGAVVVFNREGKQIFAWASGSDNILSADISAVSRRVAVSLLNTDDKVMSTVELFDINETESPARVIFEDTIIFNVDFHGDKLSAFGDNCIAGITSKGELIYDKRFEDAEFVHYGFDEAGNKILLFDNANIPLINVYNSDGELKNQLSPEELPDFVDISGKNIVYNSGRDIIFGRAGRRRMDKYTASMDIKQLMMLDNNTFIIVYSNNIEIVKV